MREFARKSSTFGHDARYSNPLAFGPAVEERDFRQLQSRLSLDFFKWDFQVGDVSTLFRQPLLIAVQAWRELERTAEDLAAELLLAEQEILERPDLQIVLGIPEKLRRVFHQARRYGPTPAAIRILRFDFHYATEGWCLSEVNSDVPGGYTEASSFTELMASCIPNARPTGNPATSWTEAMMSVAGERSHVALLSAAGFLEDQQVTAFLADQLQARGVETFLLHHPRQLTWKSGRASVVFQGNPITIDALVRFYQGEWLAQLPGGCGWESFFAQGSTPTANPGTALLTESKRLGLVFDRLSNRMERWRSLLPECSDPVEPGWQDADEWVLKAAFSNTGDAVYMRQGVDRETWQRLCRAVKRHPQRWIVQRRFEPLPIDSNTGAIYPCIGVYTINGRAAGAYARASTRRIIDYTARDIALLIREETSVN